LNTFNSAEGFIQYQDLGETGSKTHLDAIIKGRMSQAVEVPESGGFFAQSSWNSSAVRMVIEFVLTIELRDGQARVTFDNATVAAPTSYFGWYGGYTKGVHTRFVAFANLLVTTLEVAMREDRRW